MELKAVIAELITKPAENKPLLRVGEILVAKILEVKEKNLLLLMADGTTVKTRLLADLDIKTGQDIKLQVKGISEERIELSLSSDENKIPAPWYGFSEKYGVWPSFEHGDIIDMMIQEGLPVTFKNIEAVQRALKHVRFISANAVSPLDTLTSMRRDPVTMPIGELAKWFFDTREGTICGGTTECEKLKILLDELVEMDIKDIIHLVKHRLKINLANLIFVKNLRENKGFPDVLLKLLYKEVTPKVLDQSEKPHVLSSVNSTSKGELIEEAVTERALLKRGRIPDKPPRVELVNIKQLLTRSKGIKQNHLRLQAARELLLQRATLLERLLANQNICIVPFLFEKEFKSCIIRGNGGKEKNEGMPDETFELELETNTPALGDVRVYIKVKQKNIQCKFYVEKDAVRELIKGEIGFLEEGLQALGFRTGSMEYHSKKVKGSRTMDKFIDLKV